MLKTQALKQGGFDAAFGWFDGPPLLEHLETVDVAADADLGVFRMAVLNVIRADGDFRGLAGTVASGVVRPGDELVALSSGVESAVERIVTFDGDLDAAGPGRAVALSLSGEIDVSRGDWLVSDRSAPLRSHDVEAMVVWMSAASPLTASCCSTRTRSTAGPARSSS